MLQCVQNLSDFSVKNDAMFQVVFMSKFVHV